MEPVVAPLCVVVVAAALSQLVLVVREHQVLPSRVEVKVGPKHRAEGQSNESN